MSSSTAPTARSTKQIRTDILDFLARHPDRTYRDHEISSGLGYKDNDAYVRFNEVLNTLSEKRLVRRRGRKYQHRDTSNQAVGVLSVNPQGFGFVQSKDSDEEFFVRESNMNTALDGDVVLVGVAAQAEGDQKRVCEVLEVLERRRTQIVGTFNRKGRFAFVEPDDRRILQDVYVDDDDFNGATNGDKVVVSIDRFDDRKASPEGRILRVIGPSEDPNVRVLSLAMSMDVKADFPAHVVEEAEAISTEIPDAEIRRRLDLRAKPIFTIDPVDAKDFDDAIHIQHLENGNFEVGVHIADVSHYVEPDTGLDEEAIERATSVYLVDRTIPMLPEKLSNGVCSLRPKEDKLAYSCIMEVTKEGEVADYEIRETVIHSKERLTYEQAQEYIEGANPSDPMAHHVKRAQRLAKTLTERRMREGSIDFGSAEVRVVLDDDGHPVDIIRKDRIDSNRLVEEFMLLANRTVSRHIGGPGRHEQSNTNGQTRSKPLPFVYRIHDKPDGERIRQLAQYVQVFGHTLELTNGNVDSKDLNELLNAVRGQPEEIVITRAALRAMSKAEYSVSNIGHYGLGFDYYSHFTSPIRRYPDLIAHRLLKRYAAGGDPADTSKLSDLCDHCSEQERNAEGAERESVKLKQVEYAQAHVGDTFEGVVSGVTKFGVFVELTDLLVEGLVHVREMDDYYVYDESTYTLRGEKKGKTYRPGDKVRVSIAAANPEKREIDLLFE